MHIRNPHLTILVLLLVSMSFGGFGQSMTVSRNWLPAASGTEPVTITFARLPSEHYQLLAGGNMGVRWHDQILHGQMTAPSVLQFTVPAAMRQPGLTEFVLWNMETGQPLPYRGWISVVVPTASDVSEADPSSDRLATAVGAGGTGSGTGGQIVVYALSSGATVQTVDVPASQRVLAFTPDTTYAWIAQDEAQGRVARLSLATGQIDQGIQLSGGLPPYRLSAQVYRPDPRILMLASANETKTRAYLNGVQLPNTLAFGSLTGFSTDDRGRLVVPHGQACEMSATAGFTNCVPLLAGKSSGPDFSAVWKNKGFTGNQIVDLTTGNTIYSFTGPAATVSYLKESNRLLLSASGTMRVMDGDSLEIYASVDGEIPEGPWVPQRIWAPDWILTKTEMQNPDGSYTFGILAGHLPQLGPAPTIADQGVVHAATLQAGALAPGEIVSLFGQNLGPAAGSGPVLANRVLLATEVEQTEVLFGGTAAAILYAGAGQINAVVPEIVEGADSVPIQVTHYGIPSAPVQARIAAYRPGIFGYPAGGKTYAAALTPDGAVQGPTAPLRRGVTAAFYVTGIGLPAAETADAIAARPSEVPTRPSVTIGGRPAQVTYAGASPGSTAGLIQVNVLVPSDAPVGSAVEVVIAVGGQSQGNVWVAVQ